MIAPIILELYAGRSQEGVYGFYADIAAETSLPIILFNYLFLTSVDFTPSLVEHLARIDNILIYQGEHGRQQKISCDSTFIRRPDNGDLRRSECGIGIFGPRLQGLDYGHHERRAAFGAAADAGGPLCKGS